MNGQKEGEGWAPQAYTKLTELIHQVKNMRAAEKNVKFINFLACLAYVQSQNGIAEGATQPSKKKRKKQTAKVVTRRWRNLAMMTGKKCRPTTFTSLCWNYP